MIATRNGFNSVASAVIPLERELYFVGEHDLLRWSMIFSENRYPLFGICSNSQVLPGGLRPSATETAFR